MAGTRLLRQATTPLVSADGSTVAFQTAFSLDPADTDFAQDAYRYDVASRRVALASPGPGGLLGVQPCTPTSLSATGRFLSFFTLTAYEPQDTNGLEDVFVHDRLLGTVERISRGDAGQTGDGRSTLAVLSGNGARAVFFSQAANLVPNDTNGTFDVFLRERCAPASWQLYGQGLAGTGGVEPGLALVGLPQLGATPSLAIGNPSGGPTAALLLVGELPANAPTPLLGTVWVAPAFVTPLALPAAAATLPLPVPSGYDACGASVYFQALVLDPGAPRGVAFTRGLAATIGS